MNNGFSSPHSSARCPDADFNTGTLIIRKEVGEQGGERRLARSHLVNKNFGNRQKQLLETSRSFFLVNNIGTWTTCKLHNSNRLVKSSLITCNAREMSFSFDTSKGGRGSGARDCPMFTIMFKVIIDILCVTTIIFYGAVKLT